MGNWVGSEDNLGHLDFIHQEHKCLLILVNNTFQNIF